MQWTMNYSAEGQVNGLNGFTPQDREILNSGSSQVKQLLWLECITIS